MNSGAWITLYIPVMLIIFVAWELIQLYRRHEGNESALTMSQYVRRKAQEGSRFFKIFIWAFPLFVTLVGVWLYFHWRG